MPRNDMSKILLIESSSHNCSVGVSIDGSVAALKELTSENYVHAESLHPFIEECINVAGISTRDLDAVAVSSGPGSYTGLRIGVSAAKGICFALKIPLINLPTTLILAEYGLHMNPNVNRIIPMIDARRMEVYFAVYNRDLERLGDHAAGIIDTSFFEPWSNVSCLFIGDGAFKCSEFVKPADSVISLQPSASMMSNLAASHFNHRIFSDYATFEPFYLKDYIPGAAKKML